MYYWIGGKKYSCLSVGQIIQEAGYIFVIELASFLYVSLDYEFRRNTSSLFGVYLGARYPWKGNWRFYTHK